MLKHGHSKSDVNQGELDILFQINLYLTHRWNGRLLVPCSSGRNFRETEVVWGIYLINSIRCLWRLSILRSLISFHYQAVVPPNQTFGDVDGYTGAFRFRFWRYGKTVEVWCKWDIYRDLLLEQIIFTHRWSSMTICPSQVRTNYYLLQARRRGRYGPVSWKRLMQSCRVCDKMSMALKIETFMSVDWRVLFPSKWGILHFGYGRPFWWISWGKI